MVTPVNVFELARLLMWSEYDTKKSQFLIQGFTKGFSIGYQGDRKVKLRSKNLKFRGIGNNTVLWNKVMKEVKLKQFAGPFEQIPFEYYIQSPLGLVPKDGEKDTRLIFHLLHPQGTGLSVNANTPRHLCAVSYPDFDLAIKLCIKAGINCKLGKSDMRSAFRNLGLRKDDFCLLVMMAILLKDGKTYFFVDKCLPFRASISCALFQAFSNAVAHIVRFKTKKDLVNHLDDYLFVAMLKCWCDQQLQIFLDICESISFPVSAEKTLWGTSIIVFLGLLINSQEQIIAIPAHKIDKAFKLIRNVLESKSKKITLKQLQKICGFLNFLCRAVVPGRAFTRRLYMYTKSQQGKLKAHHHIKINHEMREDLNMWIKFLQHPTAYCRPFLDFSQGYLEADTIQMYSDASRNFSLGFGGICEDCWMFGQWPQGEFMKETNPSIEYLELYTVLATVLNWIHRFKNSRVVLFCDNQSVVSMINNSTSSCKNCLALIRILILHSLTVNVRVFAQHLTSKANKNADLLSRLKIAEFR